MRRPPIFGRPLTNAERQQRYRERHGRGPDRTRAERKARWCAKRKAEREAAEDAGLLWRAPPDPTNAERQARWRAGRARRAIKNVAALVERFARPGAPETDPLAGDPLFARALEMLERRGYADLLGRLRASWPHMDLPVRQSMAEGKGFKFWLKD